MLREKPRMSEEEYANKMARKELTVGGDALIPDPTPVAPPLGYIRQPSLTERIRDMVRSEHLRRVAEESGAETFEEASDFEVGDDYDPSSPYEEVFEPPVVPEVPTSDPTGVPPSSGGGEGAGGSPDASAAPPQPPAGASSPAPAQPAPVAPKPSKPAPGPI